MKNPFIFTAHSLAVNIFEINPIIFQSLKSKAGFANDDIEVFLTYIVKKNIKKKEFFLRSGQVCHTKGIINKGCFRRYTINAAGKETILNFAIEDWWIGDLESFNTKEPTIYYVQALEDSEVFCIERDKHEELCRIMPKYKQFHVGKTERSHYATIKRLSTANSGTPEEKYRLFMKQYSSLFQRVPMHYIASYLGIEPESLSRLRKRLSEKEKS